MSLRNLFPQSAANFTFDHGNFTVLDTETTGFDLKNDRILSVGLIRMRNGIIQLKGSLEIHLKHTTELGHSPAIHGITQNELDQGVDPSYFTALFVEYIQDFPIVAHYSDFDRGMIQALFKSQNLPFPANSWLDTMDLESAIHPYKQGRSDLLKLDSLLLEYGINATDRHTALGDAYSTALLLQRQLKSCARLGLYEKAQLKPKGRNLL